MSDVIVKTHYGYDRYKDATWAWRHDDNILRVFRPGQLLTDGTIAEYPEKSVIKVESVDGD